ncbi:MAG: YncE family protein [Thermoanaerobaculia bacterium]|nr:YncE family protein [Thermoanaerobaculia bacterium]
MPNKRTLASAATLLTFGTFWLAVPEVSCADTLVVANKSDATVSLVNLLNGEVAATVPTGKGPHEVAVSFDGTTAVVTDYGTREEPGSTLTVIDIREAKRTKTIELGEYQHPHGIVFRDRDSVLVTAEANKALIQVDLETGEIEHVFETGEDISHMLALAETSDGQRVYAWVANIGSGSVTVFDLQKGEHVTNLATGEGAEGIAAARGRVWVTNRAADTLTVFDVDTRDRLAELKCEGFPIRAEATPNGDHVVVSRARAGNLAVYELDDPSVPPRIIELGVELKDTEDRLFGDRFGDSSVPIGIEIHSDRIWVAHANADVVSEHDLPTGERLRILRPGREPDGMAYSDVAVRSTEPVLDDGRGR